MTDINVPPPIVPQGWDEIDTSIDDEAPTALDDEQFRRYCLTIRDLLRAAGLRVRDYDRRTPDILNVNDGDLDMQIQLDRYRTADVEIHLGEVLPDTGTCVRTASRMVRLFELARAFDQARERLT